MTSRLASVVITLDMERIQDALLNIDAEIVKQSICKTPKLKLREEVKHSHCDHDFHTFERFEYFIDFLILQHIKVLDDKKLEVVPPDADRSKIHFQLNYLKNLLPSVVVKVNEFDFLDGYYLLETL